jgi:hypothetical protein
MRDRAGKSRGIPQSELGLRGGAHSAAYCTYAMHTEGRGVKQKGRCQRVNKMSRIKEVSKTHSVIIECHLY